MIRRRLTTILLLLISLGVYAQNNPYSIHDECFEYFQAAEIAVDNVDSDEFDIANEKLLAAALAHGDEKARTLYYVEKLKRLSRIGRKHRDENLEPYNEAVDNMREQVKKISQETGYTQYYYYAYELSQTYYFNTRQNIKAQSLLNEMLEESRKIGDEYGQLQSLRYISLLYQRSNDLLNTRYYLRECAKLYETSEDPMVRRQTMTRPYCDLACSYIVGSDSARLFFNKAEKAAGTHQDSLRIIYYNAQLSALDGKLDKYAAERDYCLSDRSFRYLFPSGESFFTYINDIISRHPILDYGEDFDSKITFQQLRMLDKLAVSRAQWDISSALANRLVDLYILNISSVNTQRLDEISAHYGNVKLSQDLAEQSERVTRVTQLVAVLLTIILLGIIVVTLLQVRNLRRHQVEDAQRISDLKEANEKVRLADTAKTRFVQNMSHEVRTPLNAIVGFSQLLSLPDGTFPEEEKEEFAGHIVNNTKMLTMLLDDILNASAMDSGNYRITYEEGECEFMGRAAISSAEHRLQPGVTMTYEQDFEGRHTFRTDPRRVQQILINLLTNACKHTQQGSIKLRCSLSENPGEVTYSVTDTGSGVPPEQAEAIFDRFTKLNEFVQGTGLGLSICRDIATRMGGRVFLDTAWKEGGARFVFVLPEVPQENN